MFQVCKTIDFCYGHRLLNYDGKCRHLHGHNARVEVLLERSHLDDRGMVVDFVEIKQTLQRWIDETLDHKMILSETDPILPELQKQKEPVYPMAANPTAENLARLIFEQARRLGFPAVQVTFWETPTSFATYRG
ncbi:MAG: 6-pyruvoyl tetrahydrobiopterin synthase [Candidatus Omnitrophica bacterium CG11_big_fil_rev_8_21_14_0_20_64_10]|nr:MAG: 6-pyruvoyl tetrahydrobiopterin synthase [Candidatus Omnitrophica bacterium CG11_big_fil_rev_8_21_14_0_20_64_10]